MQLSIKQKGAINSLGGSNAKKVGNTVYLGSYTKSLGKRYWNKKDRGFGKPE